MTTIVNEEMIDGATHFEVAVDGEMTFTVVCAPSVGPARCCTIETDDGRTLASEMFLVEPDVLADPARLRRRDRQQALTIVDELLG